MWKEEHLQLVGLALTYKGLILPQTSKPPFPSWLHCHLGINSQAPHGLAKMIEWYRNDTGEDGFINFTGQFCHSSLDFYTPSQWRRMLSCSYQETFILIGIWIQDCLYTWGCLCTCRRSKMSPSCGYVLCLNIPARHLHISWLLQPHIQSLVHCRLLCADSPASPLSLLLLTSCTETHLSYREEGRITRMAENRAQSWSGAEEHSIFSGD